MPVAYSRTACAALALLLSSASGALAAVDNAATGNTSASPEMRLKAIGYRLATANGATCAEPEMLDNRSHLRE